MASDQTIISKITQALNTSLPEWFGAGAHLSEDNPERMDRSYTVILNYAAIDARGKTTPLIVKLPREKWMTSLQQIIESEEIRTVAVRRAKILQQVADAVDRSGNQNLTAIRIYGSLPEYCAIIMEHRSFITYKRLFFHQTDLLRGDHFYQTVEQAVFTAGQWIKLYHDTFRQPESRTNGQLGLIERVNESIDLIEELTGKDYHPLKQEFARKYESIKDTPNPIAYLHNDLTFNNLFITDDEKTGGFDPTPEPADSIYLDLARILTDLSTRNHQVTSQGSFFSKRLLQMVNNSLLSGYDAELDENLLNFYCASLAVEKWVDFEEEDQYRKLALTSIPGARSVFRPGINRYFYNLTTKYLSS